MSGGGQTLAPEYERTVRRNYRCSPFRGRLTFIPLLFFFHHGRSLLRCHAVEPVLRNSLRREPGHLLIDSGARPLSATPAAPASSQIRFPAPPLPGTKVSEVQYHRCRASFPAHRL